jgi:hypothetical protein
VKQRHVSAYLEAIFRFTKCWLIETNATPYFIYYLHNGNASTQDDTKKLNRIGCWGFVLLCERIESCSYDTLTLTSMPTSPTSEEMRLQDRNWPSLSILKNSSVIHRICGWLGPTADLNAFKIKIFPAGNSILIPRLFND